MKNNLSFLGFGGASLTSLKSSSKALKLLDAVYKNGITHFDTAPLYGKGYSEILYGQFIKSISRKDITITTKFGLNSRESKLKLPVSLAMPLNYVIKNSLKKNINNQPKGTTNNFLVERIIDKKQIELSFNLSLKRLNTDYIDYYLLHEGLPSFLTDDAIKYLQFLKSENKVKFLGIGSNKNGIIGLENNELDLFDVLQYEGNCQKTSQLIMQKFPSKLHFHHSCLKALSNERTQQKTSLTAGEIIAQSHQINPFGKIIFSTTNTERALNNIQEVKNLVIQNK